MLNEKRRLVSICDGIPTDVQDAYPELGDVLLSYIPTPFSIAKQMVEKYDGIIAVIIDSKERRIVVADRMAIWPSRDARLAKEIDDILGKAHADKQKYESWLLANCTEFVPAFTD